MYNNVNVLVGRGTDSDKQLRRFNDILNSLLDQFVVTVIYALVCAFLSVFPPEKSSDGVKISLLFYGCLLVALAIISAIRVRHGTSSGYSKEGNTAIFLVHLFSCSVFFVLLGNDTGEDMELTMAWTGFMLYCGFSISLSDVLSVKSAHDFGKAIFRPYIDAKLRIEDYFIAISLDAFMFGILLIIDDKKWLILLAVLLVSMLVAVILMDRCRQQRRTALINIIKSIPEEEKVLICRLGTEKVLYPSIEKTLTDATAVPVKTLSGMGSISYVIVLNTLTKKHAYMRHLDKLLSAIDAETKILDPSIQRNIEGPRLLFTWFSLPSKNVMMIPAKEYRKIVEKWKR